MRLDRKDATTLRIVPRGATAPWATWFCIGTVSSLAACSVVKTDIRQPQDVRLQLPQTTKATLRENVVSALNDSNNLKSLRQMAHEARDGQVEVCGFLLTRETGNVVLERASNHIQDAEIHINRLVDGTATAIDIDALILLNSVVRNGIRKSSDDRTVWSFDDLEYLDQVFRGTNSTLLALKDRIVSGPGFDPRSYEVDQVVKVFQAYTQAIGIMDKTSAPENAIATFHIHYWGHGIADISPPDLNFSREFLPVVVFDVKPEAGLLEVFLIENGVVQALGKFNLVEK